jgi:hypothetical protein
LNGALFDPAGDHGGRVGADWRDLNHSIAPAADWQEFGTAGGMKSPGEPLSSAVLAVAAIVTEDSS